MKRKELINRIIELSGDELETKKDIYQLAIETRKQLQNRLFIIINNK
jgi:hypothetical protein